MNEYRTLMKSKFFLSLGFTLLSIVLFSQVSSPQEASEVQGEVILPVPAFQYYQVPPGPISMAVFFDGTASQGADSLYWDFGDGTNGSGDTLTHHYYYNGTFGITLYAYNLYGSDSLTDSLMTTSIRVEVNEPMREPVVFPNPSSGTFHMDFGDQLFSGTIEIYSLQGEQVAIESVHRQREVKISAALTQGIYLVKACNEGEEYSYSIHVVH